MYLGWRTSEGAYARLADANLDFVDEDGRPAPQIVVRYSRKGGPRKNGQPFTQHLIPPAAEALRRWLERLPKYAPNNPYSLIFPHRDGRPRESGKFFGTYTKNGKKHSPWFEWVAAAGIKRHVKVYDI
jgi:integrase